MNTRRRFSMPNNNINWTIENADRTERPTDTKCIFRVFNLCLSQTYTLMRHVRIYMYLYINKCAFTNRIYFIISCFAATLIMLSFSIARTECHTLDLAGYRLCTIRWITRTLSYNSFILFVCLWPFADFIWHSFTLCAFIIIIVIETILIWLACLDDVFETQFEVQVQYSRKLQLNQYNLMRCLANRKIHSFRYMHKFIHR